MPTENNTNTDGSVASIGLPSPAATPVAAPIVNTPTAAPAVPVPESTSTPEPSVDNDKVSISDFGDAGLKLLTKKQDVKPSADIKKPAATPTTQSPAQQQPEPPVAPVVPETRDAVLTELNIPKEQWPLFRKMGNDSFNHVKEIIKQQAELKTQLEAAKKAVAPPNPNAIPPSYYEHAEGYTLLPQVKQAQQTAAQANYELKHWETQYLKIKAGEDWQDLDIDPKTGQYVTTNKTASPQAELNILGYMQNAKAVLSEQSGYVNQVKSQWAQQHNQVMQGFKAAEDQYFPQYAKDAEKNQYITTMNKLLDERGQQSNPLKGMFAKLYAFAMERNAEVEQLKAAQVSAAPKVVAQPPSSAFNGGANNGASSDDRVSIAEFEKYMKR